MEIGLSMGVLRRRVDQGTNDVVNGDGLDERTFRWRWYIKVNLSP